MPDEWTCPFWLRSRSNVTPADYVHIPGGRTNSHESRLEEEVTYFTATPFLLLRILQPHLYLRGWSPGSSNTSNALRANLVRRASPSTISASGGPDGQAGKQVSVVATEGGAHILYICISHRIKIPILVIWNRPVVICCFRMSASRLFLSK